MDVAQVSHRYRPSIGGIENYVYRLNESLRDAGHEVTTYTTDLSLANGASPFEREEAVHYCGTTATARRNPFSLELLRRLRGSDHDVYHLHNPWFLTTLEAAYALAGDATVVQTVHSAEIASRNPLDRALNVAYAPLARYVLERVDHNFALGGSERRRLLERFGLPGDRVSVVPNGIHVDEYDVDAAAVERFRETHGLAPDVPTVLYVSRLIPEKRPGVFVEAVSEHLADADVQALVVGSGEDEFVRSLRAGADGRVRFLSNLGFEELTAAYHASDLLVFLGTWEGLPTVILEAMNAGLPVVTTPAGAIPDVVADGENGTVVSPDARSVADAVRRYLDDPELRAGVGERNRELVRAEYDWEGVADEVLAKYEELGGAG